MFAKSTLDAPLILGFNLWATAKNRRTENDFEQELKLY